MRQGHFHHSLKFAVAGILTLLRTQRNARIHVAIAILVVAAGIWLRLERGDWVALAIVIGLVLICEAINTALEAVVDLASPGFHELARVAKDVAAGAVLIASITSVVVGLLVLGPPLWQKVFGESGKPKAESGPAHGATRVLNEKRHLCPDPTIAPDSLRPPAC